ncbi:MAG: hypothetical protein KDD25_01105, partial [Bdellovibrionales bacterium]|nr:hypothetical protein [Bdellovibrionales bacterium]
MKQSLYYILSSLVLITGSISCSPDNNKTNGGSGDRIKLDNWTAPVLVRESLMPLDSTEKLTNMKENLTPVTAKEQYTDLNLKEIRFTTTCQLDKPVVRSGSTHSNASFQVSELIPKEAFVVLNGGSVECRSKLTGVNKIGSTKNMGSLTISVNPSQFTGAITFSNIKEMIQGYAAIKESQKNALQIPSVNRADGAALACSNKSVITYTFNPNQQIQVRDLFDERILGLE